MKNVVLNEEVIFIEEKEYQKIKKKLNKTDDYFSEKELKKQA